MWEETERERGEKRWRSMKTSKNERLNGRRLDFGLTVKIAVGCGCVACRGLETGEFVPSHSEDCRLTVNIAVAVDGETKYSCRRWALGERERESNN